MFGLPILEVAIGLSFVYLLLSLICTTVNETIAALTQRRGKALAQGISVLLGDAGLRDNIYAHPLIKSLAQRTTKVMPSYIPADKFALALMDIITGPGKKADDVAALEKGIEGAGPHLKQALSAVLSDTQSHLPTNQQKIQAWFNDSMDRVSGAYKRQTTLWIWIIAAIVTIFMDANTVRMGEVLWTNQAVRSAVVDAAQARAKADRPQDLTPLVEYEDAQNPEASKVKSITSKKDDVLTPAERQLLGNLLLGWHDDVADLSKSTEPCSWWLSHLLGWLFTIIALTLGAPFWFDMLNKFINIRNSGRAPDEPRDKSTASNTAPAGVQQ